ncbi:hypothetical protein FACS1894204_12200 [Synergistales bacterium]|nr:hypothetical protein FACS1894204_12200 [Synergistales bacterium]
MALTVSGINNFIAMAQGDKNLQEAVMEIATDSTASFASAAGLSLTQAALTNFASEAIAKQIMPVAQIATTSVMIGRSVIKCVNGEISGEDCAVEMLMSGVGLLAFKVGMSMGGSAGAIVASFVASAICNAVIEYRSITKLSQEKLSKVNSLADAALREMEHQRNELKALIAEHFEEWDEKVGRGFDQMISSAIDNNADGIASGLNSILSAVGQQGVKFSTAEEFDDFFMDENAVLSF